MPPEVGVDLGPFALTLREVKGHFAHDLALLRHLSGYYARELNCRRLDLNFVARLPAKKPRSPFIAAIVLSISIAVKG